MKDYFASLSRLAMAVAIGYLGFSVYQVGQKVDQVLTVYPEVVADIEQITQSLQVEEWLALSRSFDDTLPEVIGTVAEVSQVMSEVEATVRSVDSKIPAILSQVELLQTQTMPAALEELSQYRQQTLPDLVTELHGYRTDVVPNVIQESQQLRQDVPVMLANANHLVENSKKITEQATQGAVKGVVMTPFSLIGDATDGISERVLGPKNKAQVE
ncbi:hypothetical protein [Vibrio sp. WXL210]|uniref:hypothetical protein n=1 Tax=Vibrio sp. WXL210 TaxID=3450709 RepID=UPI003EC77DDF